ncbi:MAG: hypothetical protein ACKV2U_22675 [Bryobacteraceae bacterium]
MSLPYGKFARHAKRNHGARAAVKKFRNKLRGHNDLEELNFMLQRAIARPLDQDVHGVTDCAIYLVPLDGGGEPMILRDREDKPIDGFERDLPVSSKFIKALER